MKKCSSCGALVPDDANFCTECGNNTFNKEADANTPITLTLEPSTASAASEEITVEAKEDTIEEATEETAVNPIEEMVSKETVTPIPTTLSVDVPVAPSPVLSDEVKEAIEVAVSEVKEPTYEEVVRVRIRKLAASSLSGTFEVVTGIQFVLMTCVYAFYCYQRSYGPSPVLACLLMAIPFLPFLFFFIESSTTIGSARGKKENMHTVGIRFGQIGNIMLAVFAAISIICSGYLIIALESIKSVISSLIGPYLMYSPVSAKDILGFIDGKNILLYMLLPNLVWLVTLIFVIIAHNRTAAAVKMKYTKKPIAVIPGLIYFIVGIFYVAMAVCPIVYYNLIPPMFTAMIKNYVIPFLIVYVVIVMLWAVDFFVRAILLFRLKLCFKKLKAKK